MTISTAEETNAGTMHNASLVLIDEDGKRSQEVLLENSSKTKVFRRGQTDILKIVTKPLGPLKTLLVGHKRRDGVTVKSDAKWFVHKVVVKDIEDDIRYSFF